MPGRLKVDEITTLSETGNLVIPGNVGLDLSSSTRGIVLPAGTDAQRPAAPAVGTIRYNKESQIVEVWNGTEWSAAGSPPPPPGVTWAQIEADAAITNGVYAVTNTTTSAGPYYTYVFSLNNRKYMMIIVGRGTTTSSQFHYDNSWWNAKAAFNETSANANPVNNTSNDMVSAAAFAVPFQYCVVTNIGNGMPISTGYIEYYNGTTYNNWNSLPNGSTAGLDRFQSNISSSSSYGGMNALTTPSGAPSTNPSQGNPGKIGFNSQASASNSPSTSYARFGVAYATENWNGGWWSAGGGGWGIRYDSGCIGGDGAKGTIGSGNARHSAGGCGDGPSENISQHRMEFSIRPSSSTDLWNLTPA